MTYVIWSVISGMPLILTYERRQSSYLLISINVYCTTMILSIFNGTYRFPGLHIILLNRLLPMKDNVCNRYISNRKHYFRHLIKTFTWKQHSKCLYRIFSYNTHSERKTKDIQTHHNRFSSVSTQWIGRMEIMYTFVSKFFAFL